jgi:hypothetical protein
MEQNMRTQQEIETAIYTLLEEYEHYDSMEHRMFLDELSESCLNRWKELQAGANEGEGVDPETQCTGHRFIAKVQCVNTGYLEMAETGFVTLADAKQWCRDNHPEHHYRNFIREDIIEIDLKRNPVQWHYRTPDTSYRYDDSDGWCSMW